MSGSSESRSYRLFQIIACLIGGLMIVAGLLSPGRSFVGYGAVILIHGLVAWLMIGLDARRHREPSQPE